MLSLAQVTLAVAVLLSTAGTYVALSPPPRAPAVQPIRPTDRPGSTPASPPSCIDTDTPCPPDTLSRLHLASQTTTSLFMAPFGLLALHTAGLALLRPHIPPWLLGYGADGRLAPACISWSAATAVPLALILGAGIPLRLGSYAALGRNFTFALATPDRLTTTGIYRLVQHPGYVGVHVLVGSSVALLCRTDGALACWIRPEWADVARVMAWTAAAVGSAALATAGWLRVQQEEELLRQQFGSEWERWHAKTARFIPGVF